MKPYTLEVSNLLEYECYECLAIEGEGTMILQNIRNCSLKGTASSPTLKSSAAALCDPKTFHCMYIFSTHVVTIGSDIYEICSRIFLLLLNYCANESTGKCP
jgi:hypothetical protein